MNLACPATETTMRSFKNQKTHAKQTQRRDRPGQWNNTYWSRAAKKREFFRSRHGSQHIKFAAFRLAGRERANRCPECNPRRGLRTGSARAAKTVGTSFHSLEENARNDWIGTPTVQKRCDSAVHVSVRGVCNRQCHSIPVWTEHDLFSKRELIFQFSLCASRRCGQQQARRKK